MGIVITRAGFSFLIFGVFGMKPYIECYWCHKQLTVKEAKITHEFCEFKKPGKYYLLCYVCQANNVKTTSNEKPL